MGTLKLKLMEGKRTFEYEIEAFGLRLSEDEDGFEDSILKVAHYFFKGKLPEKRKSLISRLFK